MLELICFILLFAFPITLSVLLNFIIDKGKFAELKDDLKYIFNALIEIIKSLSIIHILYIILYKATENENVFKIMLLKLLYFSIFFSLIILVNYFSTRYLKFKICMRAFLDELVKFIRENFILNLVFFMMLVFLKDNNDLSIGLIGSYFFFALTTIHDGYKKNIKGNNKNFKNIYIITQSLLNMSILISFTSIEKMISQYSQGQPIVIEIDYAIYALILGIIIIINYFLPQIEYLCDQLKIFLKRKI